MQKRAQRKAILMVAAGLLVLGAVPARASSLIRNVNSAKCLKVDPDKATLRQRDCESEKAQKWELVSRSDGTVAIKSKKTGKCLDVKGASSDNGAKVIQFECNGGSNQAWTITPVSIPNVLNINTIKAKNSGLCLDVNQQSKSDDARIQQYTCNNGTNQQWQLVSP